MSRKNIPLAALLLFATFFMIGCGDDKDPRLSDADALCLKMLRNGGTCGGSGGSGTATSTSTQTRTVTVTQTQTGG